MTYEKQAYDFCRDHVNLPLYTANCHVANELQSPGFRTAPSNRSPRGNDLESDGQWLEVIVVDVRAHNLYGRASALLERERKARRVRPAEAEQLSSSKAYGTEKAMIEGQQLMQRELSL